MDTVEFFKTVKRLCKNPGCHGCPVCKDGMCMVKRMARLDDASDESIEETISKVEQWAKEHPVKTRQGEFLKIFPNVQIQDDVIWVCPKGIDHNYRSKENCYGINCLDCKRKFWLAEVTDNGNVY